MSCPNLSEEIIADEILMADSVDQPPTSKRQRLNENATDVNGISTDDNKDTNIAPEVDSPLHILNSLNDHCLQQIFKRITIVDLSSVAEVCTRFKQNAEQIFSLCHEKRFRCVSLTLVKHQVFANFVHLIKSVYLNGSQTSRCLDYFNKYSLIQSLHLRSADIHVDKLKPLISKIKSLEIASCVFFGEQADLFSFCGELQFLKVKLSKFEQFLPCKIPKLEKFEYDDYFYSENLVSFIEANSQLSSIKITTVNKSRTPTNFIDHLLQFGNLKSLNVLKLPCFQFSVTPLIRSLRNNNISLEQLEFIDCRMDYESFQDIFQMKTIKILTITGIETLSHDQFVGLARELPALEVIRMETQFKGDAKITIDSIDNFIQHSKNLYLLTIGVINNMTIDQVSYNHLLDLMKKQQRKTLFITIIYKNSMKILVPKQTLLKNKEKIRIVKINYNNYNYAELYDNALDEIYSGDDESDGDSSESSDFASIIESDEDDSDDNSDDDWLKDVYNK